jgi:hypothetical protein
MSMKIFENYVKGFQQPSFMLAHSQIDYQNQIPKLEYTDYLIIFNMGIF